MNNNENPKITFDESAKGDILDFLDKNIDEQGYIIEKKDNEKVLNFEGEEITVGEFGGVQKGSEVFINNDIVSLIRLSKRDG